MSGTALIAGVSGNRRQQPRPPSRLVGCDRPRPRPASPNRPSRPRSGDGGSPRSRQPRSSPGRSPAQPRLHHDMDAPADRGGEHPGSTRHGPQPARRSAAPWQRPPRRPRHRPEALSRPLRGLWKGHPAGTPFREDQPRLDVENFYYAQEDEVFAAAERDGFGWSVHRPHTIIGYALGNAMNMGVTLAAYASLCRAKGRPFRFPVRRAQWNGLTDMTDARLLLARASDLGGHHPGGAQPSLQRRRRRCLSLELDVGPDRRLVRP